MSPIRCRVVGVWCLLNSMFFPSAFSQRACETGDANASNVIMTVPQDAAPTPVPDIIIIPVVVHVVYSNALQNISNDQILSQIAVLNNDFRRHNSDTLNTPAAFRGLAADTKIGFRLADTDPMGLPTNGITRHSTTVLSFGLDDKIKSSASGGADPWDRDQYLNIWVGNLSEGIMGYASVPGSAPETDGVVIRYSVFGATANVKAPYNKGRTTVHEVGHWLGLRHIWGDTPCGDDKIEDTPPQQGPTRGCPSGVISTCTGGQAGDMYMNFMDFTNDACMNMFTQGQAGRMREQFNGGPRMALLSSDKAAGATSEMSMTGPESSLRVYPNPARDELRVSTGGAEPFAGGRLVIFSPLGQVVKEVKMDSRETRIGIRELKPGLYYISGSDGTGTRKVYKFIKAE